MNLERYSFRFLRYVHEPLSGEYANVGVLLWAPQSRFLGFRASQSPEKPRIHLLLGAPSGEQLKDYAKAKDVLNSSHLIHLVEEDEAGDFARDLEARVMAAC